MRYFYDTEFIDDGTRIDLISIGIVSEDGRAYYAVSSEFDWVSAARHPWLPDNVLCHLPLTEDGALDTRHPNVKLRARIRDEIVEFCGVPTQLWAYYAAYDHVALSQLFGTMLSLPRGWPQRTKDLACLIDAHEAWGYMPRQLGTRHDALADAWHVKTCHDFLMEETAPQRGLDGQAL